VTATASLDLLRAGLPDGLELLPATSDHAAGVVALVQRCDLAAVGELDTGSDEIAGMLESPDMDRAASAVVRDGEDVVMLVWIERDDTQRETWVDVYIDPRRDHDLTPAALAHGLRAARGHREAAAADTWTARTGCFASDERLIAAVEEAGFVRERRFWRMRIDLATAVLPAQDGLPAGVVIRAVDDEAGRRALHAVAQESFRDHWNHGERDFDSWMQVLASLGSDDPDGWWLLEVDGVPAAVCLLDESRAELGDGYIRTLGVLREYRGRGLAQLLLERGFRYYRDRGRAGVQLAVDSDSPTGANHLYEKVGMRPVRIIDAFAQSL
jgi:ribosomal protein S18 acetylase RimI-like enzyme